MTHNHERNLYLFENKANKLKLKSGGAKVFIFLRQYFVAELFGCDHSCKSFGVGLSYI